MAFQFISFILCFSFKRAPFSHKEGNQGSPASANSREVGAAGQASVGMNSVSYPLMKILTSPPLKIPLLIPALFLLSHVIPFHLPHIRSCRLNKTLVRTKSQDQRRRTALHRKNTNQWVTQYCAAPPSVSSHHNHTFHPWPCYFLLHMTFN
jgi:hypothetical protein